MDVVVTEIGTETEEADGCQRSLKDMPFRRYGAHIQQEPHIWECLRRQKMGRDSGEVAGQKG